MLANIASQSNIFFADVRQFHQMPQYTRFQGFASVDGQ
jgi:hypothetical protein